MHKLICHFPLSLSVHEPELGEEKKKKKKRGLSVHLQPPGKKSSKQSPLTSRKLCSLTVYVCQTPSSVSLQLFYLSTELQWCMQSMAEGQPAITAPVTTRLRAPVPWLTLTPHAGFPPLPPPPSSPSHPQREREREKASVDRMLLLWRASR